MRDIWQNLALLIAGAVASILGGLLFRPPVPQRTIIVLAAFALALIMYGSGAFTFARQRYRLWARHGWRFIQPKIGIVNDMGWDLQNDETFTWTFLSPQQWKTLLSDSVARRRKRVRIKLITTSADLDSYVAVLNPYGGVYPEQNPADLTTLRRIFDYVGRGGLFVNVADIPGYWAYNALLRRKVDTTPPIFQFQGMPLGTVVLTPVRPYLLTPLLARLGLQVVGVENTPLAQWTAGVAVRYRHLDRGSTNLLTHRVALVAKNIDPVLSPVAQANEQYVPLLFATFGSGRFLISMLPLDQPPNRDVATFIADLIVDVVGQQ